MIALWLILGLLAGFYAKEMYTMLKELYEAKTEEREANKAGVVRPVAGKVTKNTPIDLSSSTGSIPRMTPDQIELARIKERDRVLRENHS